MLTTWEQHGPRRPTGLEGQAVSRSQALETCSRWRPGGTRAERLCLPGGAPGSACRAQRLSHAQVCRGHVRAGAVGRPPKD